MASSFPSRYPRHDDHRAVSVPIDDPATGVSVSLLARGETAVPRTVFEGMGERSRLQRFHVATARLSESFLRTLADVDGHHRVALVARVDDHSPVGIARYHLSAPGRVEGALAVVDHWQGRGIGKLLLRALARHAELHGVTTVHGSVMADNGAMRHLLDRELVDLRAVLVGSVLEFEGHLPAGCSQSTEVVP